MITKAYAYHCSEGIAVGIKTGEMKIKDIVAAENRMSVLLMTGSSNEYSNRVFAKNWYVTAFARPDCPKCYSISLGDFCSNSFGY